MEDFISKLSIIYNYHKKKKKTFMFQENILDLKIKFMLLITKLRQSSNKTEAVFTNLDYMRHCEEPC